MTKQEIIELMLSDAQAEVTRQGFSFTIEGRAHLRKLVAEGVNKNMTVADCNDSEKISLARRNTRELIAELCAYERRRNNMIVERRSFSNFSFRFCPRFPFCL